MDDKDIYLPDLKQPSCSELKRYQTLPHNQFPGACVVCSNPSTGYHYDVPSCNGCKSFFRRALILGNVPECVRSRQCFESIDPVDMTRKTCRSCRFEKCVTVGMNPLMIQTNEIDIERAKVLMAEVLKRRKTGRSAVVVENRFSFADETVNSVICSLDFVERHTLKVHSGGLPDGMFDSRSLQDILSDPVIFENSEIPNLTSRPGTEKRDFQNMVFAHCSLLACVEYSKTFDFFRSLRFDDKLKLAKHVICSCSNLHDSFFSMTTFKSDRLRHPDGSEIGKPTGPGEKPGFHLSTLISLLRNEVDRVEYMLLKTIVMCNSTVCSLSKHAQTILDRERRKFASCLLRYCRLKHGALNGPSRFAALLSLVSVIENQSKMHKDFHAYVKVVIIRDRVHVFPVTCLFEDILGS